MSQQKQPIYASLRAGCAKQSAYIAMAAGATLNALAMSMMKILTTYRNVPTASAVFFGMLITAIITTVCLLIGQRGNWKQSLLYRDSTILPWLVLRGLFGTASLWIMYASLRYIPLEQQQVIWYTCPLLTGLIALFWPDRIWKCVEICCGIICFVGMLLVLQPASASGGHLVSGHRLIGYIFAAIGTFFGAMVFIIVRHMGKAVSASTSLFYFGWICTLCMGVVLLISPEQRMSFASLEVSTAVLLLATGLTTACSLLLTSRAVQSERPGRVTIVMYIEVPFFMLLDYSIFQYYPNTWSWAGCAVILSGTLYLLCSKETESELSRESAPLLKGGDNASGQDGSPQSDDGQDTEHVGLYCSNDSADSV